METTFTRRNSHGANLKRWREWRGIKQEVLADKIGVSQATLSGYEKKDELEPEVLEKITKALDIPTEAITSLMKERLSIFILAHGKITQLQPEAFKIKLSIPSIK